MIRGGERLVRLAQSVVLGKAACVKAGRHQIVECDIVMAGKVMILPLVYRFVWLVLAVLVGGLGIRV